MKRRLEQFYASFGDRGVMFILYAFSVVVNSLMTICMELPAAFPEEISAAGIAAFCSGKDWSALLGAVGVRGGYLHAMLYAPLFWVFDNPYALYKAMLILNAIIVSFIPPIAYHLAIKLGVERVRHKLLAALCCGMYVSILTGSKFITGESVSCVFSWILIWCVFVAWDKKNRYTRLTMSIVTGFLCAFSYAADARLIALVFAVALTVLAARFFFKEKLMNIPVFALSMAVSYVAEHFARILIMQSAADASAEETGIFVKANFSGGSERIFGEIYSFMTGSFGMGALAMALFCVIIFYWIREGIKFKEVTDENGTKVYEPIKHKYSLRLAIFSIYQFLAVGASAAILPVVSFTGLNTTEGIGERTQYLAPIALFFVLIFVFRYTIDIKKLAFGAGVYAYSCLCFFLTYYQNPRAALQSEFPMLTPFRFGEDILSAPSGMSFIIMSSCVFSVFVLLIVLTSCTRKHITRFFSVTMLGILIYNTFFAAFSYLPKTSKHFISESEPYKKVAELLYNDSQSPPIIVYESDPGLAAELQFLKLETSVSVMSKGDKVPESCLLIAKNGIQAPFEGGSYDIVGKTDFYTVYAYGENARNFIRYSAASSGSAPVIAGTK